MSGASVFELQDVTADWLSSKLSAAGMIGADTRVEAFAAAPFGTGQSGTSVRIALEYAAGGEGPKSVVAKFASDSADARAFANAAGMYEREVRFYNELAGELPVRTPRALYSALNPADGRFAIMMEDMAEARIIDQLVGCSADEAALVVEQAAALHSASWRSAALSHQSWLLGTAAATAQIGEVLPDFYATYVERYGEMFGENAMRQAGTMVELRDRWVAAAAEPYCLWHQDFRCDNFLFEARSGEVPLAVVDWQTIGMGRGMSDIAYFVGTSLPTELRRTVERELVDHYHAALCAGGVEGYGRDECWLHYRQNVAQAIFTVIHASVRAARTERGDRMWTSWAQRTSEQAEDIETFAALRLV